MKKRVKQIILLAAVIFGCIQIRYMIQGPISICISIAIILYIGIIVASILLNEHPMEFFDNFGEYKKAPLSALFMVGIAITFICGVIEVIKLVKL